MGWFSLFACKGCVARDATIQLLRDQLRDANERTAKANESVVALADAHAHARLYPKPQGEAARSPREPRLPTPAEAMAASLHAPLPLGMTQEKLEAAFRGGARSNAGVPEFVAPSGAQKPTVAS